MQKELTPQMQKMKNFMAKGMDYEEAYAVCMFGLVTQENSQTRNPKFPRKVEPIKEDKLPKQAMQINRMIVNGLRIGQIAEILDVTRQHVSRIKQKYDLPIT